MNFQLFPEWLIVGGFAIAVLERAILVGETPMREAIDKVATAISNRESTEQAPHDHTVRLAAATVVGAGAALVLGGMTEVFTYFVLELSGWHHLVVRHAYLEALVTKPDGLRLPPGLDFDAGTATTALRSWHAIAHGAFKEGSAWTGSDRLLSQLRLARGVALWFLLGLCWRWLHAARTKAAPAFLGGALITIAGFASVYFVPNLPDDVMTMLGYDPLTLRGTHLGAVGFALACVPMLLTACGAPKRPWDGGGSWRPNVDVLFAVAFAVCFVAWWQTELHYHRVRIVSATIETNRCSLVPNSCSQ